MISGTECLLLPQLPLALSSAPAAAASAGMAQGTASDFAFWGSAAVFTLVLIFFMLRRFISPAVTVILGLFVSLICGFTNFQAASASIDLNVLFLVASMMISTSILTECGFFEWAVIGMTKLLKGNVFLILFMMLVTAMVFSAFLDNVTVMILMIPLAIIIAKALELPAEPILIVVLVAANLGGAATLLGGMHNMILGAQTDLTFNDFVLNAAPCVMGIGIVFILLATLLLSKRLHAPPAIRTKVEDFHAGAAVLNLKRMRSAFAIFVLMIAAFALQAVIRIEPGVTAMLGMALMLAIYRPPTDKLVRYLNLEILIVLIGFFILTGALLQNGVIETLAKGILALGGDHLFAICMIVLWGSALLSSFIDSIPLTLVLVPLATRWIVPELGLPSDGSNPLFWAILFGVSLGGCGSLFGSPANMLTYTMARANGCPIPARRFFYWGFPLMILQLGLCSLYLLLHYFLHMI